MGLPLLPGKSPFLDGVVLNGNRDPRVNNKLAHVHLLVGKMIACRAYNSKNVGREVAIDQKDYNEGMDEKTVDFSIRIPATEERIRLLSQVAKERKTLTPVRDYLMRPEKTKLADYRPEEICMRLRIYEAGDEPALLDELKYVRSALGYTEERTCYGTGEVKELVDRAKAMGYVRWGTLQVRSEEYTIDGGTKVLLQRICPVGEYLKIEAPSEEKLKEVLKMLGAEESERVVKNAAVLLYEQEPEWWVA